MLCAAPLNPRVQAVEVLPRWQLLLTFTNGEKRVYHAERLLTLPAYAGLPDVFHQAHVAFGTVMWSDDLDVSPDTLYEMSTPV